MKIRTIAEQVLSEDYWEGFYALINGDIVKCSDTGNDSAEYTVYSLKGGKVVVTGEVSFGSETLFTKLSDNIYEKCGSKIYLRLSNECENPDRHEEIENILNNPEIFELLRIKNLIKHLKNPTINIYGGRIGSRIISEGECGGFYQMNTGKILFCRTLSNWDDEDIDRIVDGVMGYYLLDPSKFSLRASSEQLYGYLEGETFSTFMESLNDCSGIISSKLATEGDELYPILCKALEGDHESAAIASHKLKINLCIKGSAGN